MHTCSTPLCRLLPLALATLLLTACASPGQETARLRAESADSLKVSLPAEKSEAALAARMDALLAQPLEREDAVLVALLGNPALARRYAQLEIAAAERAAAARPPNPTLTLARLSGGGSTDNERALSIDLLGLLAWPAERSLANRTLDAERAEALHEALQLARDTRNGWTDAIAAGMHLAYAQDMVEAADTARLYAQRLAEAGNVPQLDAERAAVFHAEAASELAAARAEHAAARESLARLLGLEDAARLRLPAQLPGLPAQLDTPGNPEQQALDQRRDVQAAKQRVAATARALGLNRVTRLVNVLEVGYLSNTSTGAPTQSGAEISLELPLFDFGSASGARARATYEGALAQARETAVRARSEVRAALAAREAAWQAAQHYRDEILPRQQRITDEVLLRFNGMLVGPFEVLEQAGEQSRAALQAQRALRDFWIAEAQLASALQ